MEVKVARLEVQMEGARNDLHDLKSILGSADHRLRGAEIKLATLTERVSHLPSKGFIITAIVGSGAVISAITLFGEQIKRLIGI